MSENGKQLLYEYLNPDPRTVRDEEFFYEPVKFEQKSKLESNKTNIEIYHSYGFDSKKRSNLHYLSQFNILLSVGNFLNFIDLNTLEQKYVPAFRNGAIGALAVHPSKKYIAVAEIYEDSPMIYILEYPSLKLYRLLRKGAAKSYSNICFNTNGDKLASVGGDPDYMLTIWDWKKEKIVLRSKAFSQDIFKVSFAPESDGILTTSGMGHIKFWKMASTFTGLKLQGYLGKFGATELSDIASFFQLPDGKVLSSTETGNLLLWDGGMIKCEISGKGKKPCHQGKIEVVFLVDGEVFTGGEDGYIRVWDVETIDNADVTTSYAPASAEANGGNQDRFGARVFEIEPIDEILVGKDVKINNMVRCPENGNEYLIQSQSGQIFKLDIKKRDTEKLFSFHSGPIAGADMAPNNHSMVTLGNDGNLKLYNYHEKSIVLKAQYPFGGTTIQYFPEVSDPKGCTLVAGFQDGVIRIISHEYPATTRQLNKFVLHYAFKPHTVPITCISISDDGRYLATAGQDKTVFFFKISQENLDKRDMIKEQQENDKKIPNTSIRITPLGFITFESNVVSMSFTPDDNVTYPETAEFKFSNSSGKFALVALEEGGIQSLILPSDDKIDNTLTYELSRDLLNVNPWKIEIQQSVEEHHIADLSNTGTALDTSNRKNTEESAAENSAEDKKELKRQPSLRLQIENSSQVSKVVLLETGFFLAAFINKNAEAEVRLCKFDSPQKSRLIFMYKKSISEMRVSLSGDYLLLGARDGMTCTKKLLLSYFEIDNWDETHERYKLFSEDAEYSVEEIDEQMQWTAHLHDSERGSISSIVNSFDDSFMATVGGEGAIIVWRNNLHEVQNLAQVAEEDSDENDEVLESDEVLIDDIVERSAYSIQEDKLKSEKDREIDAAEKKKQLTRMNIQELQNSFLKILAENDKVHQAWRIPRDSLKVDPDLLVDIEKKTQEKIENVKKELQWVTEKETIGLKKLREKFLGDIVTERIEIKAFGSERKIITFRTRKDKANIDQNLNILSALPTSMESNGAQDVNKEANSDEKKEDIGATPSSPSLRNRNGKFEARKQLRAQRASMWKELMDAKPDENYEDPQDVAAIRYAETHMGDYKLKTGEKYIVPESERVDADKKKRQMILLKDSIFQLKELFNKQAIKLRDRKKELITKCTEYISKVGEINKKLMKMGEHVDSFVLQATMDENAYPELRDVVTLSDIESLQTELTSKNSKSSEESNAFETAGDSADQKPATSSSSIDKAEPPVFDEQPKTDIERAEYERTRVLLKYKKFRYEKTVESLLAEFDEEIEYIAKERVLLDGDIKFAELKLLLLYREWALLKEFEKYDTTLADKLILKQVEQNDITQKMKECQDKLNSKKAEVEIIIKKEREIHEEFQKALGDSNKYEEYLTKILKKKIKRVKKKVKLDRPADGGENDENAEEEEEEEEEDDDDMSFDSDSDVSDADGQSEEVCPADCDPNVYAKVLELRERKLDNDDILTEIQKSIEVYKKEHESLLKKEKIFHSALKSTEAEIQDFQTQKQKKLNELDIVVPLRLHQIQYLEKNALPSDLSSSLVFVEDGLRKLKNRIRELQQKKIDIKKNHKELKKMHVNLFKSRKEKQAKLIELEEKAINVQMLKFGKVIDLEKLEKMGVNKIADDLKEKLQKDELKRMKELAEAEQEITDRREELTSLVREHTERVERLVSLKESKQELEDALNLGQSSVTVEYSGLQKKAVLEKARLQKLVNAQHQQIEQRKGEIEELIRKPTLPRKK